MTSMTLHCRRSVKRLARWLALVVATTLVATGLSAAPVHAQGVECPRGLNTTGCTHYYLNRLGAQVPKSNSGRGIMVGGSEVSVLSGTRVRVTTPVPVSSSRYEYRTTTIKTYKTVTRPSRSQLVSSHRLTARAANTVMGTASWAYRQTSVSASLIGETLYMAENGRVVPRSVANLIDYSKIRVVSPTTVQLTTNVRIPKTCTICRCCPRSEMVTTRLTTSVRAADHTVVTNRTPERLMQDHKINRRAALMVLGLARSAWRGQRDYFFTDRDGNETTQMVPGGARVGVTFVDASTRTIWVGVHSRFGPVEFAVRSRPGTSGNETITQLGDRIERILLREWQENQAGPAGQATTRVLGPLGVTLATLLGKTVGAMLAGAANAMQGLNPNDPLTAFFGGGPRGHVIASAVRGAAIGAFIGVGLVLGGLSIAVGLTVVGYAFAGGALVGLSTAQAAGQGGFGGTGGGDGGGSGDGGGDGGGESGSGPPAGEVGSGSGGGTGSGDYSDAPSIEIGGGGSIDIGDGNDYSDSGDGGFE